MTATTATTPNKTLDANLHLVDFDHVSATALQTQMEHAIAKGNQFLDRLDNLDLPDEQQPSSANPAPAELALSANQALTDIIHFDHINLTLERTWGIISHLNSVMSDDAIRTVHRTLLPQLSAFTTRVGQHKPLYQRYENVANSGAFFAALSPARQRSITLAVADFELSGVALPSAAQAEFAAIQSELATLSAQFSDNVLDATQAFALALTEAQLSGLPESSLALLAAAGERHKADLSGDKPADEKSGSDKLADSDASPKSSTQATPCYVATLDMPVYLALMTYADTRPLRETLYKAYVTRASEFDEQRNPQGDSVDNSALMSKILALRAQKAKLLGFANYAQLSLARKMAESVSQVEDFLLNLAEKAAPTAQQDLQQLQDQAALQGIAPTDLQPWDIAYLAEKIKQTRFKLSQEEVRPYFPLPTVLEGLFTIVHKLFAIRIEDATADVATWHKDVRFYQLFDSDDSLIGGFYFDLYARAAKRGGAWMSGFQPRYRFDPDSQFNQPNQSNPANADIDIATDMAQMADNPALGAYQQLPVCFMVGNFTPPTGAKPSLLTHSEVTTLFHEFGHGLHHLLTQVDISTVAGVNGVEWDAVELPSQFLENWVWEVEGINLISAHVDTAAPLPKAMLDALLAAKNFQSGMQTLRQIEFALFDLRLHAAYPAPDYCGIVSLLNQVRAEVAISKTPDYNRFANSFSHIFAGGYAAGYYSYKWAELLSADAFSRFEEEGIFNPTTGHLFRETVLAVGGSLPAKTNFEHFRGRAASIDALLRHSGFSGTNTDIAATSAAEV